MIITSLDNATVKSVAKLRNKKYRDEQGKYLIEGLRSVKDSFPYLSEPLLVFSESGFAQYGDGFENCEKIVCTDTVFNKIADTENSQGIICVAKKQSVMPNFACDRALFLDRVRDPGNMGTIIRTALAVGFNDIYCRDCVDVYNPKVVRSAMSAVSRVNTYEVDEQFLSSLKENGYTVLCADMQGESIFEYNITSEKVCLVLGNEANGVDDSVLLQSDTVISLPMQEAESLNVGVCASVMMYQLRYAKR